MHYEQLEKNTRGPGNAILEEEKVKESETAQSCPTLCDPVDCSPPGPSVHGSLQARILEWFAISFSRGSSHPGIEPRSPALQADSFLSEPLGKALPDALI